jgi:lysophospholipase L1-like esterase
MPKEKTRHIMVLGDSNGAAQNGWVNQLRPLLPYDSLYNYAISGNTIGFNNGGGERLNTLFRINEYIVRTLTKSSEISDVIILLGTNDAKLEFAHLETQVVSYLKNLVLAIQNHKALPNPPHIYIVSPPPYGSADRLQAKYKGGGERVKYFVEQFKKVANANGCTYINIYDELKSKMDVISKDGIHFNDEGYSLIANKIRKEVD